MKETGLQWLARHVRYAGRGCLIWPLSRDSHGYAHGREKGQNYKAHSKMCEWVHGPRPSPEHQASHSCGNGDGGCVHPKHVRWKTRSENHLERRKHGTHATNKWGQRGKVTPKLAAKVIALKGRLSQPKIAKRFGISNPTVRNIFNGKSRAARQASFAGQH